MYENPNQAIKFVVIIATYLFAPILAGVMVWGLQMLMFAGYASVGVSIVGGLLAAAWLVSATFDMALKTILGNQVVLTVDQFFPNPPTSTGFTQYNYYMSGFRAMWWWEVVKDTIKLDADIAESGNITASTQSEELLVSYQYDVTPNPKFVSNYSLNGKDETEREKNLRVRVRNIVERVIETVFISHTAEEIVADRRAIRTKIKAEMLLCQSEFDNLGVIVKMSTGKIDVTEDSSKARTLLRIMKMQKEAAEELESGADGTITRKDSLSHIRAMSDQTQAYEINVSGLENLNHLAVGAGIPGVPPAPGPKPAGKPSPKPAGKPAPKPAGKPAGGP